MVLLVGAVILGATVLDGNVVAVKDGDTLVLLVGKTEHTVRLADIDTPEKRQPYGKKAKKALSELVFGRHVRVVTRGTDRYGRWIGRVFVDEVDVNAELVRIGAAWVYRRYSRDAALLELEEKARLEGKGLWALPEGERVPPWEWRRRTT